MHKSIPSEISVNEQVNEPGEGGGEFVGWSVAAVLGRTSSCFGNGTYLAIT